MRRRFASQPSPAEEEYTAVRRALALDRSPQKMQQSRRSSSNDENAGKCEYLKKYEPQIQEIKELVRRIGDEGKDYVKVVKSRRSFRRSNDEDPLQLDETLENVKTILSTVDEELKRENKLPAASRRTFGRRGKGKEKTYVDDVASEFRFYTGTDFKRDGAKDEPSHRIHLGDVNGVSVRNARDDAKDMNVIKKSLSKVNEKVKAKGAKSSPVLQAKRMDLKDHPHSWRTIGDSQKPIGAKLAENPSNGTVQLVNRAFPESSGKNETATAAKEVKKAAA